MDAIYTIGDAGFFEDFKEVVEDVKDPDYPDMILAWVLAIIERQTGRRLATDESICTDGFALLSKTYNDLGVYVADLQIQITERPLADKPLKLELLDFETIILREV